MIKTKHIKKIVAIGFVGLMAGGLVGCTQFNPQDPDVQQYLNTKLQEQKYANDRALDEKQSQINSLSSKVEDLSGKVWTEDKLNERDKKVIEDYKKAQAEIQKETKVEPVKKPSSSFVGEEKDDLKLGASLQADTLTNKDISYLVDDEVSFDGEDYDVHEEVDITSDLKITTNLNGEEDFKDKPYLTFNQEGAVSYKFVFDEPIPVADIDDDEPLEVAFLGQQLKIVDTGANSVTVRVGGEYFVKEDTQIKTKDGKTVTVKSIGEDSALISVDGVDKIVSEHQDVKINGVRVKLDRILYTQNAARYVEIVVGEETDETVDNGDDFYPYEDSFVWTVDISGGYLNSLGVSYDVKATDLEEEVLEEKKKLMFPNDYFGLSFEFEDVYEYNQYSLSFDEAGDNDVDTLKFKSKDEQGLVVGNEEVDVAFFDGNKVHYRNDDNDWVETTDTLKLDFGDTTCEVDYSAGYVTFCDFKVKTSNFKFFGVTEEEAESNELVVENQNVGLKDVDILTSEGFIVKAPENDLDNDQLEILVPDEEVQVVVKIGKE